MDWLSLIIVIITVLVIIGIVIYLCKKKGLREIALQAILVAEEHYSSTTGQERLDLAINYVYNRLPSKFISFIPESLAKIILKNFIQKVFDEVKLALDYQKPQIEEKGGN